MSKPWIGYLGSFFILLAGVLQIIGEKIILGVLLILLSIAGGFIKYRLTKNK
jgi:hypothetical protein